VPDRDTHIDAPILTPAHAKGRPADRIAAGIAAIALFASIVGTLWFFSGFFETDPGFAPASSALLLSLGLGAFAIIPSAVILRLCWTAWRQGFRVAYGWWTVLLAGPWIPVGFLCLQSDWLPLWLGVVPLLTAVPITLWALISLWLERSTRPIR
jgi:hypothetical protein